jgi:hypothetical protein
MDMDQKARDAKNRYQREWYKRNPGKEREYHNRYWAKKAREYEEADKKRNGNGVSDEQKI